MGKQKDEISEMIYDSPVLIREEDGLKLTDGRISLKGDFTTMIPRLKQSNLEREMLVKAARLKGFSGVPKVIDATAGMGEDSLLLAAAGFQVELYEQDEIIGALLYDAHQRALKIPELALAAGRMRVHQEDSIKALLTMEEAPDVVYLDPMFPERQKSASVKKKFQLLQQLERPCSDETELLGAALAAKPKKIVIKRPLKGPWLGDRKPDYSLSGKAIRYDCIVLAR